MEKPKSSTKTRPDLPPPEAKRGPTKKVGAQAKNESTRKGTRRTAPSSEASKASTTKTRKANKTREPKKTR